MKHNLKITIILLSMFLITQFIGLYVVGHYAKTKVIDGEIQNVSAPALPYGMDTPKMQTQADYYHFFPGIIFSFIIAVFLFFLLTKLNFSPLIRLWFFVVVTIALGISLNSFFYKLKYTAEISLIIAILFSFIKIYKHNIIIHNLTELLIYPGIAAVFVSFLNLYTVIILLVLISLYDIWAVWHSGVMQKMAKYQIDKLQIFSGFFIPYANKKTKQKIKLLKEKYKKKQISRKEIDSKKIKINLAILGGGDVVFPIITAGVMLRTFGLPSAIFIIFGATLGLSFLFYISKKKKFYPAMPFITAGIFLGMLTSFLIGVLT